MRYDVVIVGAGAAGLFCAIEAGKRGRKVLVLEHNAQVGRKILISGGGRCNFTNREVRAENFVSRNPHFCKSALARYTPDDFVALVRKHRIEYYEKKLGQLFCRESARQIVEMLLEECRKAKVEIQTNCRVKSVAKNDAFTIETNLGVFHAESLVVATGGLSFPKIGATDFGYRIARQFGLKVVETRASLVALVSANQTQEFKKLAGVSVDAAVSCGKSAFRENILFTHRGLSGPAILQISNYWQKEKSVSIDLSPTVDVLDLLERNRDSRQNLANFLSRLLPARFAEIFTTAAKFPNKPLNRLSRKEIETVAGALNDWRVKFSDTEGYDRAEVTLGGVDTNELSSQTMETKRVKNLYFIGEVADVTGWLGGYNFQWAWSSAYAAGGAV